MRISLAILLLCIHVQARTAKPAEPTPELKSGLNAVLSATDELHSALYTRDQKQINTAIEKTLKAVNNCAGKAQGEHHLKKILEATSMQLQITRMKSGDEKFKPLREAFRQIIQITRAYKTDRYRIFFCKKDKAVWLQKSWRAKNPFLPKGESCGVLVK